MKTLSKILNSFGFYQVNEILSVEMQLNMKIKTNQGYKKKAIISLIGKDTYDISHNFKSYKVIGEKELLKTLKELLGNLENIEAITSDTAVLLMEIPNSMIVSKIS